MIEVDVKLNGESSSKSNNPIFLTTTDVRKKTGKMMKFILLSLFVVVSLQQTPSLPAEVYLEFAPLGYLSASYKAQYINIYSSGVPAFAASTQSLPINLTYNCAEVS